MTSITLRIRCNVPFRPAGDFDRRRTRERHSGVCARGRPRTRECARILIVGGVSGVFMRNNNGEAKSRQRLAGVLMETETLNRNVLFST